MGKNNFSFGLLIVVEILARAVVTSISLSLLAENIKVSRIMLILVSLLLILWTFWVPYELFFKGIRKH